MDLSTFLDKLRTNPGSVKIDEALSTIEQAYEVTPTGFTLGGVRFEMPQSKRSCQIYAFGQLNQLTKEQTLACFGDYYHQDVQMNPAGNDHLVIRLFVAHGWEGLKLDSMPLQPRG